MKKEDAELEDISLSNILRSITYWPRIFRLLWETHKGYLLIIAAINILQGLTPVVALLATTELINSVAKSHQQGTFEAIGWAFGVYVVLGLFSQCLVLIENYLNPLFEKLLTNRINILIMEKSIQLSLAAFEDSDIQDQLQRARQETSYRPYQIFSSIFTLGTSLITLFSTVALIVSWNAWVAALLILIPVSSFFSFLRLGKEEFILSYKRAPRQREAWYLGFLLTKDSTFKEIKLFQLGSYLKARYEKLFQGFYEEDKKLIRKRSLISLFFEIFYQVMLGAVILLILWTAYVGQLLVGNVVGMIQATNLTHGTSQGIVQGILSLCNHNLYMKNLFAYLDLEGKRSTLLPSSSLEFDASTIETVEFRHVTFQYPGRDVPALQDISFTLSRGETIAIVGKNGSGKTTLLKLMTQLYDDFQGEILINGISIRKLDIEELRKRIGVVFQDFVHYEMDTRHNIGFGDIDSIDQDDELLQAANQAGIREMVEGLPQQLETRLGLWFEEGHQLSGGQWQRIAIARAFMRKADLYILDEPSSYLDPEAEKDVFDKFYNLVKGKLGIFITHRYSSVSFADKIIVMDEGKIVEQGSHRKLIKEDGIYAGLYHLQASSFVMNEDENDA
ncbi:ATP-binding cassette subfamily B protein [Croceifilum oryzae]|uniref:ATP-binding cassette subfamily B protein n=1 Tax=Croceifilum oryzae TaxID=1553429 RepID=A0AAJ1WQE0_9BACL|nr:ABC transporter ATP-binding protein [Croceifilum oryzae]MDQ0417447.1 ATP-binding cassette subfamily B protein [Croceifilum oryzae]